MHPDMVCSSLKKNMRINNTDSYIISSVVFGIVFNLITALVSACVSALTGYMLHRENIRRDRNPNETVSVLYNHHHQVCIFTNCNYQSLESVSIFLLS